MDDGCAEKLDDGNGFCGVDDTADLPVSETVVADTAQSGLLRAAGRPVGRDVFEITPLGVRGLEHINGGEETVAGHSGG